MSPNANKLSERDEIELLLPWYATGKLDRADAIRVEAFLAGNPDLSHRLELAGEERHAAIEANEAIRPPKPIAVDRLLAGVSVSPLRQATAASRGLIDSVRDFFAAPSVRGVRWATVAALALIAVQAAALVALVGTRQDAGYETASGAASSGAAGAFALVRFSDAATAKAISETLAALGMAIVDGPKPGNFYRVRIGAASLGDAERSARIARLKADNRIVVLATPAPSSQE